MKTETTDGHTGRGSTGCAPSHLEETYMTLQKSLGSLRPDIPLVALILMTANAFVLDDESKFHRWVGYTVAGLIVRASSGVSSAPAMRASRAFRRAQGSLSNSWPILRAGGSTFISATRRLGALMIYNLLASVLVICASGYLMTTDMFWGVEWPEDCIGRGDMGRTLGAGACCGGGVREHQDEGQSSACHDYGLQEHSLDHGQAHR